MAKKRVDLAREVVRRIKREAIVMADLKFCDLFGQWQHTTIPASRITEDAFTDGFGFDGSSIRGFAQIHESDMLVVPDGAPPERRDSKLAYRVLWNTGAAADVIVWERSRFERRSRVVCSLPATVLHEGRLLYAA